MAALHHHAMRSSAASVAANSVTQLEFHQAMSDFKVMFPAMDADVIECVLRSNNGAVDATIDQLLQMAADLEKTNPQPPPFKSSSAMPTTGRPGTEDRNQLISLDDDDDNEEPATAIIPSAMSHTPPPSYLQAVPSSSSTCDQTTTSSRVKDCNIATAESLPASGFVTAVSDNILCRKVSNNSLIARFKWTPPLLGPLPESFLRFPDPSLNRMHAMHYHRSSGSATTGRPHSHSDSRLNNGRPIRVLSATMLQQKMHENELKRQQSTSRDDPETSQMLDDERLAILLQNEEFVRELRNNQEFMSQLQRDAARGSGDERDSGTSAGASGGTSNFSDAAFRDMLKNMSKVSRKKFAQVAGMFSRRRRNRSEGANAGPLNSPTHRHMSKDHLLGSGGREDEYRALENDSSDSEDRHSPYWTEQPPANNKKDEDPYFVGITSPMRSNKRDSGNTGFRL